MTQSFFMLGFMVSGLVFSYYSDKLGRRPVVLVSFTFDILALISSILSVNITQYSISRFFNGLGGSGQWLAMYTIRKCYKNSEFFFIKEYSKLLQFLNVLVLNIARISLFLLTAVGFWATL